MKYKTRKFALKLLISTGILTVLSTPALANSLPTSGGLYIASGSTNGVFFALDYIASNIQTVQNELNSTSLQNVYLDLGGEVANFGQFISNEASAGISNSTFTSYAQTNPYTIPSGITVYSLGQGNYQYTTNSSTNGQSNGIPPQISSVQATNGQITVTFNQPFTSAPSLNDFTILQSINGQNPIPVTPQGITLNSTMTQVTLLVPTIAAVLVSQSVEDSIEYQGSTAMTASFTVNAIVPGSLQLSTPVSLVAGTNTTTTITATVKDTNGQPIQGIVVNWSSSNSNVATITNQSTTDASGTATATLTVGAVTGTSQITASTGGLTSSPAAFSAIPSSSSSTPTSPSMLNVFQPNADQNDATYWGRAQSNFYLSAQTYSPSTSSGPSLLNVSPGQVLYIFAYSNNENIPNNNVSWMVNSPYGTVNPSSGTWTMSTSSSATYQAAEALFTATKPGIYTIQANDNGMYSIPLVITVGFNQLQNQSYSVTSTQSGIQLLPSSLPSTPSTTQAGVTYIPYPAEGNWIPISGSTTLGVTAMNVILNGTNGQEWTYRLPVVNGQFSGMVESPFTGTVSVVLFPHYFETLTQSTDTGSYYYYPNSSYQVLVIGNTLDSLSQSILASAHRDYNMSPQFSTAASTLLENSPSLETAVEAISNYSSSSITYNTSELQTVNYIWQDTLTAWNTHSGVCEDYSSLAAALLQSVGIPTQTVGGWANENWSTPPATDTNAADAHQWDQYWNGNEWVVFDPTWNTDDFSSIPNYISNEFFTNTSSLSASHLPDPSQTGTDLSINVP